MTRLMLAVVLASSVAGCITDGPYSRSTVSSLEPQRVAPAVRPQVPQVKQTQTAQAPQRQKLQVSLRQRAQGPLVHRAEYPIILGAAF